MNDTINTELFKSSNDTQDAKIENKTENKDKTKQEEYDAFFDKTIEELNLLEEDIVYKIVELVDKGYIEDEVNILNKIPVTIRTGFITETELLYEYMEQEADNSIGVFEFKVALAGVAMCLFKYKDKELKPVKTLHDLNKRIIWIEENIPLAIHSQIQIRLNRLKKIGTLLGHEKINDMLGKWDG